MSAMSRFAAGSRRIYAPSQHHDGPSGPLSGRVPSGHGRPGLAPSALEPARRRDQPVPAPARPQPGGLVPVGPGGAGAGEPLDRPIFLSIGYAACHWCHVMERESFEDEATAAYLNAHFVAIKVDREERPDIDAALHGRGAGHDRPGRLADERLPDARRPAVLRRHLLPRHAAARPAVVPPGARGRAPRVGRAARRARGVGRAAGRGARRAAAGRLGGRGPAAARRPGGGGRGRRSSAFDPRNGGWGRRAQVPAADDDRVAAAAPRGRRRPAPAGDRAPAAWTRWPAGGIHDQLGGGFHRYATDAHWLVPHFEQMLYDNAQLARVYAHAWALTGDAALPRDRDRARSTTCCASCATPEGGFAASQDADTEGEEGATFVWSAAEIREVLGDDAALFAAAYGATDEGNWEGHTILSRVRGDAELAERFGLAAGGGGRAAGGGAAAAHARRAARPQPARDDKVLAAWNGLAIARARGCVTGARCAGSPGWTRTRRVPRRGRGGGGRGRSRAARRRTAGSGVRGRTAERTARRRARGLREPRRGPARPVRGDVDERWFTPPSAWRTRSSRGSPTRPAASSTPRTTGSRSSSGPRASRTTPMPSGGAMAATVLLRLAALTGEGRYRERGGAGARDRGAVPLPLPDGVRAVAVRPRAGPRGITEVAIIGARSDDETARLLARRGPRVPPVPRPGGVRDAGGVRGAAAGGAVRAPRAGDGVRVPRLRVPPAGPRAGGARRATGRVVTGAVIVRARPGRRAGGGGGARGGGVPDAAGMEEDEGYLAHVRDAPAGGRPRSTCWSRSTVEAGSSGA